MKLKKTFDATGHSPASYEVYVENVLVGYLKGWSMPGIKGNPKGHDFKPVIREAIIPGVPPWTLSVGPRGTYRKNLERAAIETYYRLIEARHSDDL